MAKSQNGYRANDRSVIASYAVPGGKLAMRKGDVATVLSYVAKRFHSEVEKLVWPGNWGYAERKIRGSSSTLSNHASGTAIDLNAPRHFLGARNTFSSKQVAAIRRILKDCEGVVRWGGDYRSRKDEMHFEINKSASAVKKLADKIRAGKKPGPSGGATSSGGGGSSSSGWKAVKYGDTLKKGVKGDPVKDVQKVLGLKVDGYFGADTEKALKEAQKRWGLAADGIVGPATWKKVKEALGSKPAPKPKPASQPKFPLPSDHWYGVESSSKKNHSGYYAKDRAGIKLIQKKLGLKQDGIYGVNTRKHVTNFQKKSKLTIDGVVGSRTWAKMF